MCCKYKKFGLLKQDNKLKKTKKVVWKAKDKQVQELDGFVKANASLSIVNSQDEELVMQIVIDSLLVTNKVDYGGSSRV